jgi:hypothetical protein
VLAGARATLEQHRPALYFEFTPSTLGAVSDVEPSDLLGDLEQSGYRFEVLGGSGPVEPTTGAGVMAAFDAQDQGHLDIHARAV